MLKSACDPLNGNEKDLLWRYRVFAVINFSNSLPKLVSCVAFTDVQQVAELHSILNGSPRIRAVDALEMLDYKFADSVVGWFCICVALCVCVCVYVLLFGCFCCCCCCCIVVLFSLWRVLSVYIYLYIYIYLYLVSVCIWV
jgi:Phosphoinositide 3-kinase family, accessory domain (PIK domain)